MEFVFLAYPSCPELHILSFLGVSLVYGLIITGNILIVVSIHTETHLCTSMYYFLGSLSGIEICYTAVVVPHILANTLQSEKTITLLGCATQMAFFIALGSADCFLLAAMAYDRYVAICHPLQYPLLMTLTLCVHLVVASVISGLFLSLQLVAFIFSLPFCQARGIEHFFCDVPPVMHVVCAQSHIHEQSVLVAAILAILPHHHLLHLHSGCSAQDPLSCWPPPGLLHLLFPPHCGAAAVWLLCLHVPVPQLQLQPQARSVHLTGVHIGNPTAQPTYLCPEEQ